jgi:hypothetical protein
VEKAGSNVFWSGLDVVLNSRALIFGVILMTAIGIWGGPAGNDVRAAISAQGATVATITLLQEGDGSGHYPIANADGISSIAP